ncbi:MAG: MFS transporter [Anaerolineae bacterium]|nr:MFS transporter [Anaerolineae bacterium]
MKPKTSKHPSNQWTTFRVLWAGQSLSLLGTAMTRFAVLVWAYEASDSVMALALLGFFSSLTFIIASPFAGVMVDRWDRRKVMLLADLGAGAMTALLLGLNLGEHLQIWHLYLAQGIAGVCEAFQHPAFSAAVSLVVPKEEYTRANGLLGVGRSAARVLAPALAGLVQQVAGLNTVMIADLTTLALAVGGVLLIRIPAAPLSDAGRQAAGTLWRQMRFGIRYILHDAGLRGILLAFFMVNLFGTVTYFAVLSPMILARTGGDEVALGVVRTVMSVGGVAGSALISLWGGTRRKAHFFLISTALSFLFCDFMTATSRSVLGWCVAGFLSELTIPFIDCPYVAIWQERVPPDVQGRVFATRDMVQIGAQPIGYLMGGILADRLFEPAMMSGGALAGALGWLVGTGPGAGMAAMFLGTSLLGGLTGALGLLSPAVRKLDKAISD